MARVLYNILLLIGFALCEETSGQKGTANGRECFRGQQSLPHGAPCDAQRGRVAAPEPALTRPEPALLRAGDPLFSTTVKVDEKDVPLAMYEGDSPASLGRGNRASFLFFVSLHSELSSLSPIFFSRRTS